MDILENFYKSWREEIENHNAYQREKGGSLPVFGSTDCGKASVVEDFSNYVSENLGLRNEITFEKMLVLEINYEEENELC